MSLEARVDRLEEAIRSLSLGWAEPPRKVRRAAASSDYAGAAGSAAAEAGMAAQVSALRRVLSGAIAEFAEEQAEWQVGGIAGESYVEASFHTVRRRRSGGPAPPALVDAPPGGVDAALWGLLQAKEEELLRQRVRLDVAEAKVDALSRELGAHFRSQGSKGSQGSAPPPAAAAAMAHSPVA